MIILGLTGKNASGKGEVAKYLNTKSFSYLSLSDIIRDELKKKGLEENRKNLIETGNMLRKSFGPGVLAQRTLKKVSGDTVIDSIRSPIEVKELKKHPDFVLVNVYAPVDVRFERAMSRGRDENAKSIEEFKEMEDSENTDNPYAQQVGNTIKLADYTLKNDKGLDELFKNVDDLLKRLSKDT